MQFKDLPIGARFLGPITHEEYTKVSVRTAYYCRTQSVSLFHPYASTVLAKIKKEMTPGDYFLYQKSLYKQLRSGVMHLFGENRPEKIPDDALVRRVEIISLHLEDTETLEDLELCDAGIKPYREDK